MRRWRLRGNASLGCSEMLTFDEGMAAAEAMIRDLPFWQAAGVPAGVEVPPEFVKAARYMLALHRLYAARQRREGRKRQRRRRSRTGD
jgi:hypothetical protein